MSQSPLTLKSLYQDIQTQITNGSGTFDLVPTVLSTDDPIGKFYASLIPGGTFTITEAALDPTTWADSLTEFTLTGQSNAFGLGDMATSIVFSTTDTGVLSNLTATLADGTWNIDGIDWFGLSDPFVGIQVYDSSLPVIGTTGGIVTINTDINLTLSMSYPVVNNVWQLKGSFGSNYPGISNFYQLVGGVNLTAALPQPFSTLTDLGLKEFSLDYDSAATTVNSISVDISTQPDYKWQILPGLAVNNIDISSLVQNPGNSQTRATSFIISGDFTIGPADSNNLIVTATYPDFEATISLDSGTIQLGDLLTMFWSGTTIDLQSEITGLDLSIAPTQQNYSLSCAITTNWTFFTITSPDLSFLMTGMSLDVSSQQGSITGKITGLFHIGPTTPNSGVDLSIFAGYDGKAWSFGASTGTGQTISLGDIATSFLEAFGLSTIPSWVTDNLPNISNVSFLATVPDDQSTSSSYNVKGDVDWHLQYGSFDLQLDASVDITYDKTASGTITGTADASEMLGLTFIVGYKFGAADTEVYLTIPQFSSTITYTSNTDYDKIDIKFTKISLGELVSTFVGIFSPGFSLPSPWNLLNSIDLSGFEFTYTRYKDSSKSTIVATIPINVDLGFINIKSIKITKDSSNGSGVFMYLEGTFLGLTIENDSPLQKDGKGSDVTDMPAVPGMGSQFFDLQLLAMGQHVSMYNSGDIESVDAAITALSTAFTTTSDPNSTTIPVPGSTTTTGALVFDQNSNWLIGADFTVAKFYRLAAVFNDPNMYGLLIGVSKDAKFLKNLQFEILYKKISESVGVYQIALQLPDEFRHLEFGEVSITLPNIGVKIYTNGNFYIDVGFPASITDFSRSFSVQVFPFLGFGGFYFGYLSGATSTNVPTTTCGVFNPVIEFGLGLSLGVGKTIDEGILKAGLSLTAVGIFQGVLGFFTANSDLQTTDDTYYKIQGTFGLTGHIYGEINFAIISARLDIMAYAYVTLTIESYKPIPISFEAGVSVSLKVKVNLGLFSIKVSLHFSATVSASFTIGSDTSATAPWNVCPPKSQIAAGGGGSLEAFSALDSTPAVELKWQPVTPAAVVPLDLVFVPQLTVSGESGASGPQYVAMLYINSGTTDNSLASLTEGILYWAINAMIGNTASNTGLAWLQGQDVTAYQITQLLCYFNTRTDNVAPFNYENSTNNDIKTFISTYFKLNISAVDATTSTDMDASVFPIIPELSLNTDYNGTKGTAIEFDKKTMTGTQNYISDMSDLLAAMGVDYESQVTKDAYALSDCDNITDPNYEDQPNLSFPTFIFTDFIALAAKQMLQGALDYLNQQDGLTAKVSDVVTNTVTSTAQTIGGMSSRFMLHGLRLPAPPLAASGAITPLYMLTGQQIAIPSAIKKGNTYSVELTDSGNAWIDMVGGTNDTLTITVSDDEIQHIIDVGGIKLAPTLISGPSAIVNYNDTPQSFSLGNPAVWQYPGDYYTGVDTHPSIWKLPSNLASVFANGGTETFTINTLTNSSTGAQKGEVTNSTWSTTINFSLQKITAEAGITTPLSGNMYNLVGADDASIILLEELISYINTHNDSDGTKTIEQIQVLYQPDPTSDSSGGYISAANTGFKTSIVQANLSTETNPTPSFAAFAAGGAAPPVRDYNVYGTPGDFIKLLWECSIVRSGGYYFYYNTNDNKGLPDTLFADKGVAELSLVITYDNLIVEPFVNSVVIGDDIDTSKTSVYTQSTDIITRVATILPGCVGYEVSRNYPGEYTPTQPIPTTAEDQVYLQTQFNLIGAELPSIKDYKSYLPAGPVDAMTDEQIAAANSGSTIPNDETSDWNYNAVMPYYKYVQPTGTDPNYPNPYAGIGTDVSIALNWQDMFGNIPPANTDALSASMKLLYSDAIVALSQWSSVSVYYLFELQGSDPTLDINFTVNTSRYTGDNALNNAQIDLLTYMSLFYQLSSGDIDITYTTSIENKISGTTTTPKTHTADVTKLLSGFINPIIAMLKTVAGGGTTSAISTYTISTTVDTSNITTLPEIAALTVDLTMARTANIDPNFTDVTGVASATTTIQPYSTDSSSSMLSLASFAQQFETAFINQPTTGVVLKVTTGTNETKSNSDTTETPPIWIVRFDTTGTNGIKFSFNVDELYYFSPIPLATSLQAFSASINAYQSGAAYPVGTAVTKNFNSIDMDSWGLQFLEAIDKFLSPAYAVPAYLLATNDVFSGDPDYLQSVLDAKQKLAEAIEGTIEFIIDPCDDKTATCGGTQSSCAAKELANIGNAQEKWKQQMLKELSNAYRYVASVQTTASIKSEYTGVNNDPPQAPYVPALYGNMQGDDPSVSGTDIVPKSTEYSLSTAKVPSANGKSWLTFMFEAKDTSESRSFTFGDMKYSLSHIEFDIQEVPDMDNYLASSWLAFVIPFEGDIASAASPLTPMADVGKTEIPVPLRAYPTPPSISAQNSEYPIDTNPPTTITVQDARTWDYTYTYQNPSAAQDTVITEIAFNVTQDNQTDAIQTSSKNLPLYQALAQFTSIYPSISNDFDTALSQLTPEILDKTNSLAIDARYAMLAFIDAINSVATAWSTTNQVNPRTPTALKSSALGGGSAAPYTIGYTITESAQKTTDYLLVAITPNDAESGTVPIAVEIDGYTPEADTSLTNTYMYYKLNNSGTKEYLLYEDRNTVPSRTVSINDLDILNTQNAWSSVAVIRNEELLQNPDGSWKITTPCFIYQTPQVKFYNKLIPLLSSETAIDIAKIGTTTYPVATKRPLNTQMLALFDALTENISSGITEYTIKMQCDYSYTIPGTTLPVEVPVVMITPTDIEVADSGKSIADMLTQGITDWQKNDPETNDGAFTLVLTAYSTADAYVPILQIPFTLALTAIS